ncbi:GMC family oxidoreductase [Sphingomonas bisphenolicum]|uniref:Choline dehydrogenase n=1 Tax=Sphingomonas bisphenolicum TaxID=296544 RepID=A0ABM7G8I9_9SPHN|nr:GMC family oxidoreductase N-terminal domain-containing protein [Sphingomonas bisphenolicum]BBF71988.1 choline dehydrogenase [Sphingomonas bisphenolicum]
MTDFDYIVVGSGSGGGVVASRLSEDPANSVLVLEAGGSDWNFVFHMGIGFYRNRPANLNWGFKSQPEPHLDNRSIDLPQGHLLGGSSSINGKVYSRGNPIDYDEWRQMGCEGWSYEEVLPYFKRAEGSWRPGSRYHGVNGPLKTTRVAPRGMLSEPLVEAARSLGYPIVNDLDAEPFEGISPSSDITVDQRGRRSSTARTYLRPAMRRPNLKVELHAKATRILVENGKAVGIEFMQRGKLRQVRARKEIILSAGVYNTPRLLLLSGIGNADELAPLGIAPILNLPGVGTNIADHAATMMENLTKEPITPLGQLRIDKVAMNFLQWALLGKGPFATQPLSGQGLIKTQPSLDRPDVQVFFNPLRRDAQIYVPGISRRQEHRIEAGIVLLRPYSRGTLKLGSSDPAEAPKIQLNLLSDQRDLDTFIRALRQVRKIYHAEPLSSLIKQEVSPGLDAQSDEELTAYLRRALYTVRHPVGSCRMGNDEMSVVDSQLRVRGIAGLRIADASIMPAIPGGNTNAPAIMIGEKAADMILGKPPLRPAID